MSKTKVKSKEVKTKEVKETKKESTLYFFYTQGCAWCKKVMPIVEELNKDGHDILMLDLADSNNQGLQGELKQKYNAQCGTPWFIDAETGHQICGFREKDILEKWVNGEDIPAPPRPTGPMPKPPYHGASDEDENKWKEDYKKWSEDNSHMPNLQTAEQILDRPRPKSDPPRPPAPGSSEADIDTWGVQYGDWAKDNQHLPNLLPVEKMVERFKQRAANTPQGGPPNAQAQAPQPLTGATSAAGTNAVPKLSFDQRLTAIESKVDKILGALGV
tara:strand:- start:252 stop:1070 length:819 start_codon:yes stop_codon:yes gene_type:complete